MQRISVFLAASSEAVLSEAVLSAIDDRRDYGETRTLSLGAVAGRIFVVAHTRREARGKERIRIISVRKANAREQERYHQDQDSS